MGEAATTDGRMQPHHPVTVGPGGSVPVALIVRVACGPPGHDAPAAGPRAAGIWSTGATSPVVVHYQVLGLRMSQTLTVGEPVVVAMCTSACQ